jgi:flavin-dependent dehydrogenase
MTHKRQAEVIVGAGTSGCCLAWRLAPAALRVLVLEKQRLADGGQAIDISHMDEVRPDQFGLPRPGGVELPGYHPGGPAWSPDLQVQNEVRYAFNVMHKPAFQRRLHGYGQETGAEVLEGVEAVAPVVEGGLVLGVRAMQGDAQLQVRGISGRPGRPARLGGRGKPLWGVGSDAQTG